MSKKLRIVWLFFSWILLGLLSCEVEDCRSAHSNALRLRFYNSEDSSTAKRVLIMRVEAVGNDSIFVDDTLMNILSLQVNPTADSSTFHMTYMDSIRVGNINVFQEFERTITVSYSRSQRVISPDCGIEQAYTNLEIESTNFTAYRQLHYTLGIFNEYQIAIYR